MKKILFLIVGLTLLSGCLKEELPIKKPILGNGESVIEQVKIGKNYGDQLFYRLEDSSIVMRVDRNSWDLAFETAKDGFHILINNGRGGGLRKTNKSDFSKVMSDNTVDWGYDAASWSLDSTFIGDWRGDSSIYVFYRGIDTDGTTSLEKYKFRITDVTESQYTIEYCELSETTPIQATIQKREGYDFSLFSLISGKEATQTLSPKQAEYDICFRTYTYIYPDGIPYLVVGCLLNPYQTSAVELTTKNKFEDVNLEDAVSATLSNNIDAIGFMWKEYGFSVTYYTVYPEKIYIVKTQNEKYYKIHFLDYYDENGVKGSPKFEYQLLE